MSDVVTGGDLTTLPQSTALSRLVLSDTEEYFYAELIFLFVCLEGLKISTFSFWERINPLVVYRGDAWLKILM